MVKKALPFIVAVLFVAATAALADVPQRTSYQGRLTDIGGNPLSGNYDLTFRIYSDSVGGSIVYEEAHVGVPVTDGLFSVLIGGKSFITPFDDYTFIGKDRFLSIQVGADPELSPRTRLSTSPYAFRVSTVDSASGGTIVGKVKVAGDAFTTGNLGVGAEFPSAGAVSEASQVLEIAAATGSVPGGAALSLSDAGVGNTWDMIATSSPGALGFFANSNGLLYIESNGDVGMGTPFASTGALNVASRVLEINAPDIGVSNSGAALTLVDGGPGFAWDIVATSSSGNNLAIYANGQGRVFVEPDGDVGLGDPTPNTGKVNVASRVLQIDAPFVAANNSGAALTLTDGSFGSAWDIVATSATGGLAIYGNSTQVMFMEPNGEVGIGTATPSVELHVVGDVCYTGSIGACSDERYKTEVQTLSNSLEKVTRLRGVTYRWKQGAFPDQKFDNKAHLGFIAQEVESLYPEMVLTDDNGYKSVDYGRLTPVLVEAIKEQQAQIDDLKALVQQLLAAQNGGSAAYGQK